jgi:signal transduction histidine kinase
MGSGLTAPAHAHFGEEGGDVILDRLLGEEHLLGDLTVGETVRDVGDDHTLLFRQAGKERVVLGPVSQPREQTLRHLRVEKRLTRAYPAYVIEQLNRLDPLEDVSRGSGEDGGHESLGVGERREHERLHLRKTCSDVPTGLHPTPIGKTHIEHNDIGVVISHASHGLVGRSCLADHGHVFLSIYQCLETGANHLMVVHQENAKNGHNREGSQRYRRVMTAAAILNRLSSLIASAAAVAGEADLETLLRRLVTEVKLATGAPYVALGVIGAHGVLSDFVYDGIDADQARTIGHLPTGKGVLGTVIRENRTIILDVIGDHPESYGFPQNHPAMGSFLGVPLAVGDRAYGNLYLTDKAGGFTDEDVTIVEALSRVAGTAVQTARLQSRIRDLALVEERERIARDLHDSVIQDLFAVGLGLQVISARIDDRVASATLDDAVDRLDSSVDTLRNYIFELKESSVATLGERLQDLVARMGSAYPARVRLSVEERGESARQEDEAILMLATEAISNALRHSRAAEVEVWLEATPGHTLLAVIDDGIGFERKKVEQGMGLANMRARAAALGGTLAVDSKPGQGTRVEFRLPGLP